MERQSRAALFFFYKIFCQRRHIAVLFKKSMDLRMDVQIGHENPLHVRKRKTAAGF